MKIPQFALLSPDPFVLQGVGTLKSPTLKEISPSNMMKYSLYALATQVLFGSKQDIIELGKNMGENNTYYKLIEPDIEITSKYNLIINFVTTVITLFLIYMLTKVILRTKFKLLFGK